MEPLIVEPKRYRWAYRHEHPFGALRCQWIACPLQPLTIRAIAMWFG
jgi:hypothetical protein